PETVTAGSASLAVVAGDLGADGSKAISAQFSDGFGNSSTTAALIVTLDTVAPSGGTPVLAAASDSGISHSDDITNVTAPTFTVALGAADEAGDTVQLLLGGSALAHPVSHTITAAEVTAGSVSLAVVAGDLGADGSKAISAQFSDLAGNSSTTAALSITLDTTAPTVTIKNLGGPTNQAQQTISGTVDLADASAGATVTIFDGATAVGTALVQLDGSWSTSSPVTLNTGSNALTAQFSDAAGNTGTSTAVIYTLNTTAPSGGTPVLAAAADSGTSHSDDITNVTAPSFTVALGATVVAGDTVQLLLGGSALAHPVSHTITAAEVTAGSVSLAVVAGDLGADGSKAISAQFSDLAGNSSTTAALSITLDTTAPTVTIKNLGGPTNQAQQTISGTVDLADASAGATVTIFDGATAVGTALVQLDGSWSTSSPVTLNTGSNALTAQFSDAAGNTGTSTAVIYTLNTTAPSGGTPVLAAASDSGTSHSDDITNVTAPSFTVALGATVVAGDTVQLLLGGSALAHPVSHTITAAEVTAGSASLAVVAGDLGA